MNKIEMPRDLRLHKGNPHEFDVQLSLMFETAKSIGAPLNRSACENGIVSDSLYQKEQVRRHILEQTAKTKRELSYGSHKICGFNQDTIAYDHAKYFEDEIEDRRDDDFYY